MPADNNHFDARLDLVPQNPGVYLMKDAAGSVIYVGKAINLRNRLRSYFTANPQGTAKVLAMISHIADFATIVCSNELEALVLESTLIKKYQPHYNILLRDDRDYPYLRVTMNETYPRLLKAFRIGDDREQGARYYGPYLSGDVYHALRALYAIFPMKTCRRVLPRDIGKERPCLNYHIGRCIGPCLGNVPVSAYRAVFERICLFLEGRYEGLLDDLKTEMTQAAQDLHFEQAAILRDRIQALERLMQKQTVVSNRAEDMDVIGLARNDSEVCLQKLEIRQGRLVAAAAYFWPESDLAGAEILQAFLVQHYPDAPVVPPQVLIPESWPEMNEVQDYLRTLRHGACRLHQPKRGDACRLLAMAEQNAGESLRRHTLLGGGGQTALQESLRLLGRFAAKDQAPHRIEAFDISNTGAEDRAASLVVFQEGKPLRQQYRLFKLAKQDFPDDYEAMRETLRRRFRHLGDDSFGLRPDLVLVDGGRGHVTVALQVMSELGLALPVAGMVKDDRHHTRGLALPDGSVVELQPARRASAGDVLRLEDAADPAEDDAELEKRQLLRLLTAIQDEAHRFAGQYRGKLARKRQTRFSLEGIPGIGPSRRRLLLERFRTVKEASEADLADLLSIKGLGEAAARAVYAHFHPEAAT
jgi:excinuclease ABC subunit C